MAGIVLTKDVFQSASKVIKTIYSKTVEETKPQYPVVLNSYGNDADREFFSTLAVRGLGLAAVMPEGGAPKLDQMAEGELATFNMTDYALSYAISRRATENDPARILSHFPRFLAYSMQVSEELQMWQVLNLAFTATGMYDSQPLISAAHPLQGNTGINVSNSGGTTALSVESLHNGFIAMQTTVDDRNLPTYRTPKTLLVGTGISQIAEEITGSRGYPNSDDNKPNVVYDAVNLVVSRYFTLPTAWIVLAAQGAIEGDTHSLFYSFKTKSEQRTWQDNVTESVFHACRSMYVFGAVDWRGVYGSQGS